MESICIDNCEAIYEYGDKKLTPIDTLPEFENNHPQLKITGTVFKNDGNTPAENVIIYIYHTNRQGIYEIRGNETGWAKRHGFIQGWVKTRKDGKYTFYTFKPAAYPNYPMFDLDFYSKLYYHTFRTK